MHPAALTPGVLDTAAVHAFTTHASAALALVLCEATGWPLVALTWSSRNARHDGRIEDGTRLHYGVRRSRDHAFVDVRGAHTDEEILAELGQDAQDDPRAIGLTVKTDVRDWQLPAHGEPVPLNLARTFTAPVLARLCRAGKHINLDLPRVIDDYLHGDSTLTLGKRYGVHHATIHRRLDEIGIARTVAKAIAQRTHRPRLHPGQLEGLATDLGTTPEALAPLLTRHGFLTRTDPRERAEQTPGPHDAHLSPERRRAIRAALEEIRTALEGI